MPVFGCCEFTQVDGVWGPAHGRLAEVIKTRVMLVLTLYLPDISAYIPRVQLTADEALYCGSLWQDGNWQKVSLGGGRGGMRIEYVVWHNSRPYKG